MDKLKRSAKRSMTGKISVLPNKDNPIVRSVIGYLKDKGKHQNRPACDKSGSRHDKQGVKKLDGFGAVRTTGKEQGENGRAYALTPQTGHVFDMNPLSL